MSFQKPYVKVEMYDLDERITNAKLSAKAQLVYFRLGMMLRDINSNKTTVSLGELVKKTNMSRLTVIKAVKELKEKDFVEADSQNGRPCKYTLLIGIYNGRKELLNKERKTDEPSNKNDQAPSNKCYQVPSNKCYQVINSSIDIYKQNKKEQQQHVPEKQKPKRASGSGFSKSKINLAKRYTKLLQESGRPVKVFSRYVEAVCQKNEEMDTWDNLRFSVDEMKNAKIIEKNKSDHAESEKSVVPQERMSREDIERLRMHCKSLTL